MKHIVPINEGWAFVKGCETAPAAIPAGAARVDLPHCWNALDGQDGGSDYWRGPCCYLKTIEKPAGKNVYVEVEAASSVGKIIVNGVEKASHKGGYSLFRANVTDALHDGENLLAIWVDNTQRDDVYPQTADFTFYGGLYRGVNLITVEDSRFDLDYCGGKGFDVSAAVEDGAAESLVRVLSGGEQAKVRLCKLINKSTNVLLLDEPTNHLDVDAKDELKRALQEYRGSILLICHEPEFYQDIVNEVWDCSKWTTKIL